MGRTPAPQTLSGEPYVGAELRGDGAAVQHLATRVEVADRGAAMCCSVGVCSWSRRTDLTPGAHRGSAICDLHARCKVPPMAAPSPRSSAPTYGSPLGFAELVCVP
eukprot:3108746-Prymnesium_polylepis.1